MKRTMLTTVLMAALAVTSCSKNDEGNAQDALIGSWLYTAEFDDGEEYPLSECEMKNTLIFASDESFQFVAYGNPTSESSECEVDGDSDSGNWTVPTEGTLIIDYKRDGSITVEYTIEGDTLNLVYEVQYNDQSWVVRQVYVRK